MLRNKISIKNIIFGEKGLTLGEPIQTDYSASLKYFENKYRDSQEYIKSLIEKLNIYNLKIISIGSGFGAEEILFSQLGNNFVECIEPDELSRKVHSYFIEKLGVKRIKLYNGVMQSFNSKEKFDLIYSSSPSDWMHGDFREIIPDRYLNFMNRFGKKDSFVVFRLYGGSYDNYVLSSQLFIKQLALKINKKTRYKLREYWLSKSGTNSIVIASSFVSESIDGPIQDKAEFSLKYKFDPSESIEFNKYDNFAYYVIVFKKIIKLIRIAKNKIFPKNEKRT